MKLGSTIGGLQRCAVGITAAAALCLSAHAQILINGAGSTFAAPLYTKWFSEYRSVDSTANINYQAVGSGSGITQVSNGTVDFGATDGPMTDKQIADAKIKVLHFPTALGGVVPTYNIPGLTGEIKFTPQALAGIYLGKITRWDDPAIASVNKDLKLPSENITVVHRADGSGTTYVWTDYLSSISPEWKAGPGVGTAVKWPGNTLASKGNDGVTGLVKNQKFSIGYVELIYAAKQKIPYGRVQNKAGEFILADLKSVTEAAAAAAKVMPADFRVSIVNAPGKGVYPISSFTWLLIPQTIADPQKKAIIVGVLKWAITKGQDYTEGLDYAPLPKEVVAKELKAISLIK
ncbi:MAG: phosphate ABC transporter substrate-binding protein PstS [Bryobacteraceae bacterium]